MTFAISQFTSKLVGDGARPNLFQCVMAGLPDDVGTTSGPFSFMVKSAQLPGSTLGIVPIFYQGREIKFAGNRTFADWTVTVINDEDFRIRNSIEKWMNSINSHEANIRNVASAGLKDAANNQKYTLDAKVNQYGKDGNINKPIKTYNFVGMFPVDLSPIDLDWGTNDTIEEFTVTFAYQYWSTAAADGKVITT
jgi:hypothetical protein